MHMLDHDMAAGFRAQFGEGRFDVSQQCYSNASTCIVWRLLPESYGQHVFYCSMCQSKFNEHILNDVSKGVHWNTTISSFDTKFDIGVKKYMFDVLLLFVVVLR